MKKILLALALALSLSSLWAGEGSSLSLAIDLRGLDALFLSTLQAEAEVKLNINDEFTLRIPVSLTSDLLYNEVSLWESGLFLDYHPFRNGLYLSVSLLQMGFFSGFDKPEASILFLNEVAFGYTWHITQRLYLEPRLVITDPSGVFESEYDQVKRTFPDRSKFRIFFLFGWEFLAIPSL
ncbi:MAG TPA: hypothetical protein VJ863_07165 [Sphaerochaeta sp.]|nr:hypothetical protein [Sphaerochaeta sp.]